MVRKRRAGRCVLPPAGAILIQRGGRRPGAAADEDEGAPVLRPIFPAPSLNARAHFQLCSAQNLVLGFARKLLREMLV